MHPTHSRLSNLTSEKESSTSTDRSGRQYICLDMTELVRRFINTVDFEVTDLGYDLSGIIGHYNSADYLNSTTDNLPIARLAEQFITLGYTKDYDDSLTVADYTLTILYPAILRMLKKLGYHAGVVVQGSTELTGRNRKIYCSAVLMVV